MAFEVERAISNRSKCVICEKQIVKGEKRVRSPYLFDGHLSYYCYHPSCFVRRNKDEFLQLLEEIIEEVAMF